jgi:hypothetical protein
VSFVCRRRKIRGDVYLLARHALEDLVASCSVVTYVESDKQLLTYIDARRSSRQDDIHRQGNFYRQEYFHCKQAIGKILIKKKDSNTR